MLLLQYDSQPNMPVDQKSTVLLNMFVCLKLRQSKVRSRTFQGISDLHLRSTVLLRCLAILELGALSAGMSRHSARNENMCSYNYAYHAFA